MIAVIDYGMGNLRSVQKALEAAGAKTLVTSKPADLEKCSKLVFPGVGAFGDAMIELKRLKLVEPIKDAVGNGKLFLGLCLGLQLLFEKSEEAPGVKGLSLLKGESKRFRFKYSLERSCSSRSSLASLGTSRDKFSIENLKVPHMGWNNIASRGQGPGARVLKGVPKNSYMYFVHSYYVVPKDKSVILTTTDYGIGFVSGICKDNIYGFQFHPEKSQSVGLRILENFVRLKCW